VACARDSISAAQSLAISNARALEVPAERLNLCLVVAVVAPPRTRCLSWLIHRSAVVEGESLGSVEMRNGVAIGFKDNAALAGGGQKNSYAAWGLVIVNMCS
jgi:hypothetical protein